MSGPSCRSTSFDLPAAWRNCSRSNVPTFGMSRSIMNLRNAIVGLLRKPSANPAAYIAIQQVPDRRAVAQALAGPPSEGFDQLPMTLLPKGVQVHVALGITDMRKGLDG